MKHTDPLVSSIPEHIDRTLITLKTDDDFVRFRREVQADWNHQIGQPPILLVRWEAHMQEYLLSVYEARCHVWRIQGNKITPEFIRGVFQEDIRNLIKKNLDTLRDHPQLNHMPERDRKSYLGQLENSATGLHYDLLRKIESEAIELEYLAEATNGSEEQRTETTPHDPRNIVEQRNIILAKAYNHSKENKAEIAAATLDKYPWTRQDPLLLKWNELSFTGALEHRTSTVRSLFSKTASRYKSDG